MGFTGMMREKATTRKGHHLILAVDDDPETLKVISHILKLESYDVALANDGSSALALFQKRKPDLIILDIMMPKINGLRVIDLVRQRSDVPIIMLTAKREATTVHDALLLGADDYMVKPFRAGELLSRIKAKLRRAEQSGGGNPHPNVDGKGKVRP